MPTGPGSGQASLILAAQHPSNDLRGKAPRGQETHLPGPAGGIHRGLATELALPDVACALQLAFLEAGLLRFVGREEHVRLDAGEKPEFDRWCWVDFWYPASHVVSFKRRVYERALRQFAPLVETSCQVRLAPWEGSEVVSALLAGAG